MSVWHLLWDRITIQEKRWWSPLAGPVLDHPYAVACAVKQDEEKLRIWPQPPFTQPNDQWESIKTQLVVNHAYFSLIKPSGKLWCSTTPLPSGNFHWSDPGGGMDIFWNYTIFPYHGEHFHSKELDKTMEIRFSNLFLLHFQNISIHYERGPMFPMLVAFWGKLSKFNQNFLESSTVLLFNSA